MKEKKIFTELDAYISGDLDEGLFVFQGHFNDEFSPEQAEEAIWEEIEAFKKSDISDEEIQKVKNQVESSVKFGEITVLNKAMTLCMAELLEDADLVNTEFERYEKVTKKNILDQANEIFRKENCSTLIYKKS